MRTSIGFWDALFGEKVTVELPSRNGGVKKVQVTKKWIERKQQTGMISPVCSPTVKVNILDPVGGLSLEESDDPTAFLDAMLEPQNEYRVEYWAVGEQIPQPQHDRFVDRETKELYALTAYQDGKASTYLISRRMWEEAREAMRVAKRQNEVFEGCDAPCPAHNAKR